jgi:hypothetical protein
VQAVVEVVQGEKGEFSSVKYLNPPGGSATTLKKADAKSLSAKFGAKTRALFGGTPVPAAKPAAKPPVAKPAVAKKQAPPAQAGTTSTMETCWDKYLEAGNEGDPEKWYAAVKDATGKEQNACTPEDWGKMMAGLTDNLPL